MKYRNTHTGEVQEWHVKEVRVTPIEVMVSESGSRWARLGVNRTPVFLRHHELIEEPDERGPAHD